MGGVGPCPGPPPSSFFLFFFGRLYLSALTNTQFPHECTLGVNQHKCHPNYLSLLPFLLSLPYSLLPLRSHLLLRVFGSQLVGRTEDNSWPGHRGSSGNSEPALGEGGEEEEEGEEDAFLSRFRGHFYPLPTGPPQPCGRLKCVHACVCVCSGDLKWFY